MQANSDCHGDNETDINRSVCVQVSIFNYLLHKVISCINSMQPAVRGINKTQFSCFVYIQGYHKLHKRPTRMPFSLMPGC